jgi:hypothetical protein
MNLRITLDILLIIAALILAYLLFDYKMNINSVEKIKIDTVYIDNTRQPIKLNKIKPKLIYQKDTTIITNPFKAVIDTVIKKDTIKIDYNYPENDLNLSVISEKDTLKFAQISKNDAKEISWYNFLPPFLIGIILGLIGVILK